MPFALIIVGVVLLITSVRGTLTGGSNSLVSLLQSDFTGSNNFVYWLVAILVLGGIGYIPKLKPVSIAMLTLVIIVLVLTKGNAQGIGGGFFSQLTTGLATTQNIIPAQNSAVQSGTAPTGGYLAPLPATPLTITDNYGTPIATSTSVQSGVSSTGGYLAPLPAAPTSSVISEPASFED